jgi:pheromone shutdown protein TraB
VLAVMGAGHEQEILNLVLKSKEEIFSEYKKSMDSKKPQELSYTYSFSI